MTSSVLTISARYFLRTIVLVVAVGDLGWCPYPSLSAHQEGSKAIYVVDTNSRDPVRIVDAIVEKKRTKLNKNFSAGQDWLRDSEVIAKNVSDNDIIYIELQVFMPDTKASGNEMLYRLQLGNKPGLPVMNEPLLLHPNEEATFILKNERYKSFLKVLNSRHNIADINRLNVRIGFVVFADLTGYSAGLRFKQNPNKPNSWIPDPSNPQ